MDLLDGIFAHEFLRNALLASTGIALAAGLAGYFVVLRGQVFASDALSHVAFTGGVAALAYRSEAVPCGLTRVRHSDRRISTKRQAALLAELGAIAKRPRLLACGSDTKG